MALPSILVVDDEPHNFDVIEALLFDKSYNLNYASNGAEAIQSLELIQPDVILLDVMMPGINGIEICRQIKAIEKWRMVPIIIVTALNRKEDLAQCFEAGADDFISKPINKIELRARVNSMLRIKQHYDLLQSSLERQAALEKEKVEASLKESENRYASLASVVPVGIFRLDLDGHCLYVNDHWSYITGMSADESEGLGWLNGIHPEDRLTVARQWYDATKIGTVLLSLECRFLGSKDNTIWVIGQSVLERNEHGQMTGFVGTITDITERKEAQKNLLYNSLHDPLTSLANRTLLIKTLEVAIAKASVSESYQYAVLFLDLDRFKVINDSLGHLFGDQLLQNVAQKLQSHLKPTDLIARIGGDEFVILLEDIAGDEDVLQVVQKILHQFQTSTVINGHEVFITTSIGLVFGNSHYKKANDLIRDADIALYRAKSAGKATYRLFDARMHTQAVNRLNLETQLRKAFERDEFVLHYQPIMDIFKKQLVGFEALVRWQHPTRGLILPSEFIPITEETGMILRLDDWVINESCRQLSDWRNRFPNHFPLKISVNLSVQDLRAANLVSSIESSLSKTGLSGDCITLEITESMLIDNIHKTIDLLNQLREKNIHISIDDFGTGYSSLKYLHLLPADYLKIDRSFVSRMAEENRDYQVVNTIINLSNQLGVAVIAEGIETNQQLKWLEKLGCEFGQGYFFSKPLPASEIEQLLFQFN
jgi:diguanylate cyclase (GGDEF)-like protein/PAS domain S-box-containing protein